MLSQLLTIIQLATIICLSKPLVSQSANWPCQVMLGSAASQSCCQRCGRGTCLTKESVKLTVKIMACWGGPGASRVLAAWQSVAMLVGGALRLAGPPGIARRRLPHPQAAHLLISFRVVLVPDLCGQVRCCRHHPYLGCYVQDATLSPSTALYMRSLPLAEGRCVSPDAALN